MKILLLHNYYQGFGGENVVFETERDLLISKGHDVCCFTRHNDEIQSSFNKLKAGLFYTYNTETAHEFEACLEEFKPDIIHAHNIFPLISPAIFKISKKHGIPSVMTLHNFRLICPNALLLRDNQPCENCITETFAWDSLKYNCYRNSKIATACIAAANYFNQHTWTHDVSAFITFTAFSQQLFLKNPAFSNPKQFFIKPNFVSDLGFSLEKKEHFIYVGRLSEEKGIRVLLDAFQQSNQSLKIIGDGPLRPLVEEYIWSHTKVSYLGFLQGAEVREYLKTAKALIIPSVSYEGCPMTILEAYSCGTPVIGSHIGNIASFVQHQETGLLFEAGNPQSLALQLDAIHIEMSQNAREKYERLYTPEVSYQKLLQIYESVKA